MAETGNVLKGLGQILQVPGQLRDAEQQREQQVTEQQMREFDLEEAKKQATFKRFAEAQAITKQFSKSFEPEIQGVSGFFRAWQPMIWVAKTGVG